MLLPLAGSLAALTTGVALYLVVLYAALKDQCRSTPSPPGVFVSEAPDAVRVTLNGWPLGTTCDWALAADGRESLPSGSIPMTLFIYTLIAAGVVGTVVFGVMLRRRWGVRGWRATGVTACLALISLTFPLAVYFSSPGFFTARHLLSGSPASLCVTWFDSAVGDAEDPADVQIDGSVGPPLVVTCSYINTASQLHERTVSGWTWPLATTAVVLLGVSAGSYALASRILRRSETRTD
ncbi:hypothetical protein [Leifsonia sp. NPDC080035]|uniref:Integral membrane protein n=1 Tax=Leifsonia sp. NPDC080035 TaxID=3143936 RepID=A0AAU7G816_9MICO